MSIAIVGGGLAGFSAALEAVTGEEEVVLFDARDSPGGRARTREHEGFLLNEGAHALYVDGAANAFLRELGCEPAGGVPPTSGGVGVDGDVVEPLPTGARTLLRTPLLKGDRVAFARLFARISRIDPAEFAAVSARETMRRILGDGIAADVALAFVRLSTYGNDPDRASGDAGLIQLGLALRGGVRYVDGGWQTITDSLAAVAAGRGVKLVTGTKFDRVRACDGRIELSAGSARHVFDRVVLAAGGPASVAALLDDESPTAGVWAARARPAAVAALDVGLGEEWGRGAPFALGIDRPLYLSVHAPVARLAPKGHTLVHVSRYLHPDEPLDPERDRAQCEELLDRIRPGWRSAATMVRFGRRLVAATDQPRADAGGLVGRPAVDGAGVDGVFVAGDWVGPRGLLADAAVASGRAAGRAAADDRTRVEAGVR